MHCRLCPRLPVHRHPLHDDALRRIGRDATNTTQRRRRLACTRRRNDVTHCSDVDRYAVCRPFVKYDATHKTGNT